VPQLARSFLWAACVPPDARPCEYEFVHDPESEDQAYWAPTVTPRCEDNVQVRCVPPAMPSTAYQAALRGTTTAYLDERPCGAGETCTIREDSSLACLLDDADCASGRDYCLDGRHLVDCGAGGLERDCHSLIDGGGICLTNGRGEGICAPSGAVACDPETYDGGCISANEYRRCYVSGAYVIEVDCAESTRCFDPVFHDYDLPPPCECADFETANSQAVCVTRETERCDPASWISSCVGATASVCLGDGAGHGLVASVDCSRHGLVCMAGTDGQVGCALPSGDPCDGRVEYCDGDLLTGCCDTWAVASAIPCAAGYLTALDCSLSGASCEEVPFPDCVLD
jgi:hypothetical protein